MTDVEVSFFDIPPELREIIYSYFLLIKDLKTQLAIRNVCTEWYCIMREVTVYNNENDNKIKYINKFKDNEFKTIYENGNLYRKIVFESYCKFNYVEYNKNRLLVKIINNKSPFEIITHKKLNTRIHTQTINTLTGKLIMEISEKFKCINMLNPFIEDFDNLLMNNPLQRQALYNGDNPMCIIS